MRRRDAGRPEVSGLGAWRLRFAKGTSQTEAARALDGGQRLMALKVNLYVCLLEHVSACFMRTLKTEYPKIGYSGT